MNLGRINVVRRGLLGLGEAAPWFRGAKLGGSDSFGFHLAGGRAVLMLFFGSAAHPEAADALAKVRAQSGLFDNKGAAFFGVTIDPADGAHSMIRHDVPGLHFFLDHDRSISRLFGAHDDSNAGAYRPHWLVLDRTLRVTGIFALREGEAALAALAKEIGETGQGPAPILAVPNVFEARLCRQLIDLHRDQGSRSTGFMRQVDGKSTEVIDANLKSRRDHLIADPHLIDQLTQRLRLRLLPMVQRAFQFEATHVERALIGCYEAEAGGHFRAHRDNTGPATAHRRFAVTINLNAEDYEGGDLVFPEFGSRAYRATTGGAIVFSCGLMHQVLPVTRGRRYAYLPFLFDESGASVRQEYRRRVASQV